MPIYWLLILQLPSCYAHEWARYDLSDGFGAVAHYEGTILLVSHDRYFIKKFHATDTFVLSDGKLVRQPSFEAYVASAEQEAKRLIARL